MNNLEQLVEISKNLSNKYDINNFSVDNELFDEATTNLKIAVLGQFNAGKTTLVNAMIGQNILPAMSRPTSKCLVSVVPDHSIAEPKRFRFHQDGNVEEISPLVFQELAMSKLEENLLLKVPPNEFFRDGIIIIDTPGLNSLDETDSIISLGLLPYIDGVIISHDIHQGEFPRTMVEFLSKGIMRELTQKSIFVLTRADEKSPEGVSLVKNAIKTQIRNISSHEKDDADVIAIDAKSAITNKHMLSTLKCSFLQRLISQKKSMFERRRKILIRSAALQLLDQLEKIQDESSLDIEVVKQNMVAQNDAIADIRLKSENLRSDIEKIRTRLYEKLACIAEKYVPRFAGVSNPDSDPVEKICNDLINDLGQEIQFASSLYFKEVKLLPISENVTQGLSLRIKSIINKKDLGVMLSTAAIAAIILPGAGVTGNAIEAAGGGAGKAIGRGVGKNAARIGAKAFLLKSLSAVASVLDEINPIEHAGRYISAHFIEGASTDELRKIAFACADEAADSIKIILESDIFPSLESELENHQKMLSQLLEEAEKESMNFSKWKQDLSDDILSLQGAIKNLSSCS